MPAGGGLTLNPPDNQNFLMPVIQSEPSLLDSGSFKFCTQYVYYIRIRQLYFDSAHSKTTGPCHYPGKYTINV